MNHIDNPARGHVSLRTAADSQISSNVPPELWKRHREEIAALYRSSPLTLEEIREHMRRTYLFEASPKQYKAQLREWGLGRYNNPHYAAHILKLHVEAEQLAVSRRVYLFGKEKSRQHIKSYIRKSLPQQSERSRTEHDILARERELLAQLPGHDPLPPCITYEDTAVESLRPTSGRNSFPSTPYSRSSSSARAGGMDSSPSVIPSTGRTSQTSLQSSPTWSLVNDSENLQLPAADDLFSPFDQDIGHDFSEDESPGDSLRGPPGEVVPQYQTLAINASQLGPINSASLVQPLTNPSPTHTNVECSPYFSGSISVSPVHHWTDTTSHQIPWETLTEALGIVLDDKNDSAQLNLKSHATYFLLHCLQGCMLQNQKQYLAAAAQYEVAMNRFQSILVHQFDECLSTLSSLVALFESYGQRLAAREILLRILKALHARVMPSTATDPIYETVTFMCQTQLPEYGTSGTYDILNLESIRHLLREEYGARSKLTLMARYNVAWAKLEQKQFETARSELLELKPITETVFGRWHIQAISCAATLARAHLRCGELESANILIEETVVSRVRKVFSESHPYYWEARHRQGTFLKMLSEKEQNSTARIAIQTEAETILREVLLWRLTILGSNNPRTAFTFQTLKALLDAEGKVAEANDLHLWCTESCQKKRQQLWGNQFVLTEH